MSFFDKLLGVVNVTANKTGDFTQVSKMKLDIRKCNSHIKDISYELGESIIKLKETDRFSEEIFPLIDEHYQRVNDLKSEISNLETQIKNINNK